MAKRFIDTDLFKDEWFADLSNQAKVFWLYYITNCDHAGILKVSKKHISFNCGCELADVIAEFGQKIVQVNENVLFMPNFFFYQYPHWPNKRFRAADSAYEILLKYGIDLKSYLTVSKELPNCTGIVQYSIGIGKCISNGIGKEDEPF